MRQKIISNLKNVPGWRTSRKLVVFSVDDYGNVRVDSKAARKNMDEAGLKSPKRFDSYDALETTADLEGLYEVLSSVKDKNSKPAVFTPYAVPCNIDFETMAEEGYNKYHYERLPDTFSKLSKVQPTAYANAWELWKQGMEKGLLAPQFHGREHLNLRVFQEKLDARDHEVLTALKNRSYTSLSSSGYSSFDYSAAFGFWSHSDLTKFPEILETGLSAFEEVFGSRATVFTPPAQKFHPSLVSVLYKNGITAIDRPFFMRQHLGEGTYRKEWHFTKYTPSKQMVTLVRNAVFEPIHDRGINWIDHTFAEIEAAFRWNKPANISSHRVNFCGHIDPENREKGLKALKELLDRIVKRWPDVEFISAGELVELILKDRKS